MIFLTHSRSRLVAGGLMATFVVLGWLGITNMGVVGEVAWTWMSADASSNLAMPPRTFQWGPFTASSTRPMVTLTIHEFDLPLAVNMYTGGLPDWPARIVSGLGFHAVEALHLIGGGLLIILVHRFLSVHATAIAACSASLLLATDWIYIFFRRALGGTELFLSAAVLLCLWAIWSRRWAGGRHGLTAFAAGIGLGVTAKLTFFLSLIPLVITAVILRNDKPRLRPPLPSAWRPIVIAGLLPILPLALGWLIHVQAELDPLPTHDHITTQWERVSDALSGGDRPQRESLLALKAWLGNGTSFLGPAWGTQQIDWFSPLRVLGWVVILVGVGLAWLKKDPTPRLALNRFLSVFVPLQVALIWIVARDLHHLAIATPMLMLLAGVSIDTVCSHITGRGTIKAIAVALVCCTPWTLVGLHSVSSTDTILDTASRPTITSNGLHALAGMLDDNGVQTLVTFDYEVAGSLDLVWPHTDYRHGWTRVLTNRKTALIDLLQKADGGHILVIPSAPAWTYNLRPREADLLPAAEQAGVGLAVVDRLPDGAAVLYAVGSQKGQP